MKSTWPKMATVIISNQPEDTLGAIKYHAFRKGELHKRLDAIKEILKDLEEPYESKK